MGRSVSYASGSLLVAYDQLEYEDDFDAREGWKDYLLYLQDTARELWPSFWDIGAEWAGREDRIILRNRLAEFGVSEYCGLVSIWVRPRPDAEMPALAEKWVWSIQKKFFENFGSLKLVGRASNGEAFFQKKGN